MNASTILDRLDTIINRDDYTRALGLAVLNEVARWIENEGDWKFMESIDSSQTLASGTQQYTVPTRFKRDIDVCVINSSSQLRYLTELRGTQKDRATPTTNQSQRPLYYDYFAGSLYVFPVPGSAEVGETIRQRCYVYLADMTDSTGSTNKLTEEHPNLLISGTARDIFNIFEDYEAAKIWHDGKNNKHNFTYEWDCFLKSQGSKELPSTTPRLRMRMK